jgi:hypothetical protein
MDQRADGEPLPPTGLVSDRAVAARQQAEHARAELARTLARLDAVLQELAPPGASDPSPKPAPPAPPAGAAEQPGADSANHPMVEVSDHGTRAAGHGERSDVVLINRPRRPLNRFTIPATDASGSTSTDSATSAGARDPSPGGSPTRAESTSADALLDSGVAAEGSLSATRVGPGWAWLGAVAVVIGLLAAGLTIAYRLIDDQPSAHPPSGGAVALATRPVASAASASVPAGVYGPLLPAGWQTDLDSEGDALSDEELVDADLEPSIAPVSTGVAVVQPRLVLTASVYAPGYPGVNLRRNPAAGAPILRVLRAGTRVELLSGRVVRDGRTWQQVRLPGGTIGWMSARALIR